MLHNTWQYDIRTWYPEEGVTFLGNGFFGGCIPREGHGVEGTRYASAVAAFYKSDSEDPIDLPHWLNAPLTVNGQPVYPVWVNFRQILDLHDGTMSTAYDDNRHTVRVETETFCHRARKNVAAYRMTITAQQDVEIVVTPQLNLAKCSAKPNTITKIEQTDADTTGWHLDYGDAEAQAVQLMRIETDAPVERFVDESSMGGKITLRMRKGEQCTLRVTVINTIGENADTDARRILQEVISKGYEAVRQAHIDAMARLWDEFSISMDNPYLERRARSAMFYLLTAFNEDVVWGAAATGLSSKASWGGSIFWDTEFYMFPPLLASHPELARNPMQYRYNTLEQACSNAAECGEQGARFAWQSKKTGRPFAGGGFEEERHISGDIAYCAWWYAQSTGDEAFMQECVTPILREVARNWASRALWNAAEQRYEIHGVVPADEHVEDHYVGAPVNNSAMTNAYAQWVLAKAAELDDATIADEERTLWRKIAAKMYLPHDDAQGIYLEYDGYNGHPIKQADVGHMFFPLHMKADPEEIRRNVYFYADRERETGLFLLHSPSAYGVSLSRTGDVKGVGHFLRLSERNIVGPFEVPRESNYGGNPVLTSAGSFLTLMIYGVLGIDSFGDELSAHPCVPEEVGTITASGLYFKGKRYTVTATASKVSVEPGSYSIVDTQAPGADK